MEYLSQKLRYLSSYFVKKVENKERKASKYEIYFEQIYKVLNWEDNTLTLGVFLVYNFLFCFMGNKIFGLVFFTILFAFLWDSYYETREYGGAYQGKYVDSFDEICSYIRDIAFNLKVLRKESPSSFCIGMSLLFLFLSFVARNISSYLIVYVTSLAIFFVPLGLKHLPEKYTGGLKKMMKSLSNVRGVLAEEELIPFIFNKDFNEKDADLDSLLTDKTADSATNSLTSGISAMPSYLDIAESQEGIEEEDLLPSREVRGVVSYTPGELSSDSDSDHRDIQFDSTHFNGDSSSEEEKLLGTGLKFSSDLTDVSMSKSNPETGFSRVLSNFATMGSSLVANVIKSTVVPVERKNSSSDSEFEIINSDDIRE